MYNNILLPDDDDIPAAKQLAESLQYKDRYVDGHFQTKDPKAPDFLCCGLNVDLSYTIRPKEQTRAEFDRSYANVPADERRTSYMPNPSKSSDQYFSDVIRSYANARPPRNYQPLTTSADADYLSLESFARVKRLNDVGVRAWQNESPDYPFYMTKENYQQYQTYIDDTNVARYNALLSAQKTPEYRQWKEDKQKKEDQLLQARQKDPLLNGYPTDMTFKAQKILLEKLENEQAEQAALELQRVRLAYQLMTPQERQESDARYMRKYNADIWQEEQKTHAAIRKGMPWYKRLFYGGDNDDQSTPADKPVHSCFWWNVLAIVILLAIIVIVVVAVTGIIGKPAHHKTHHYLNIF